MKIYVASSWRNHYHSAVVRTLSTAGHVVYDYRDSGFNWAQVDPTYSRLMAAGNFLDALKGDVQEAAFVRDMSQLIDCDAVVMVMPCGRSAHLELGWACGNHKLTIALITPHVEPELMYKMVDHICVDMEEVLSALSVAESAQHTAHSR